ncbi:MAG: hypothetical protein QOC60_13 [Frankiaceae bacterium]|nr:hypothetical protein [Frankiaceae bacterium]
MGMWAITAPGESSTSRLANNGGAMTLWQKCGQSSGIFRAARSGEFTGWFSSFAAACAATPVKWMVNAVSFRARSHDSWALLDLQGAELARFTRADGPAHVAGQDGVPPVLTPALKAELDRPLPALPTGATPVTADQLVGSWIPADGHGGYLLISGGVPNYAGGIFRGDDGCNKSGGSWQLTAEGGVMASPPIGSTLALCDGRDLPRAFSMSAVLGFDGPELLLVSPDGAVLMRLRRGVPS